jgi:maltose O-acetyltransferase
MSEQDAHSSVPSEHARQGGTAGPGRRLWRRLIQEVAFLHVRLLLADILVRFLPHLAFPYLRTAIYRLAGVSIGRGSLLGGRLHLIGRGPIQRRLHIGAACWITAPFFADLNADITIGDHVTIGHHVVLVTSNHDIGPARHRAGPVRPAPIVIGDGAWISAGAMVLPGAHVGAGSVIGAGALVAGTIPPGVVAVGVPARVLRKLGEGEPGSR